MSSSSHACVVFSEFPHFLQREDIFIHEICVRDGNEKRREMSCACAFIAIHKSLVLAAIFLNDSGAWELFFFDSYQGQTHMTL
jgi:hypothetical protein